MHKPISAPTVNHSPTINKFNYLSKPASALSDLLNSDCNFLLIQFA